MPEPIVVTQKVAAQMLSVSVATLRRWTRAGTVPSVTLGGLLRYRVADLHDLTQTPAEHTAGNPGA